MSPLVTRVSCSQTCHVVGCVSIYRCHWRLRLAKVPQIFGNEDGIQDIAGLLGIIGMQVQPRPGREATIRREVRTLL